MAWTKNPDKPPSFCDWKITLVPNRTCGSCELCSKGEGCFWTKPVTYAVHSVILGRRFDYFQRIFVPSSDSSMESLSELKARHSRIVFPGVKGPEAFVVFEYLTVAFEMLLNQCYQHQPMKLSVDGISIDRGILVGMWYLVDFLQFTGGFRVEGTKGEISLEDLIWNSLLNDTEESSRTGPGELYEAITAFRDAGCHFERLQSMVAKFCVETGHESMAQETYLARTADLLLWKDIVALLSSKSECHHVMWSYCVAKFQGRQIRCNGIKGLDYKSFLELTSKSAMPVVWDEAALWFLIMEQLYREESKGENQSSDNCKDHQTKPAITELETRCIDALVIANLESPDRSKLRSLAIEHMSKNPPIMALYLNRTLDTLRETKEFLRGSRSDIALSDVQFTKASPCTSKNEVQTLGQKRKRT